VTKRLAGHPIIHFYARQHAHSAKRVLAMVIMSVRLCVRLFIRPSDTTRYRTKPR